MFTCSYIRNLFKKKNKRHDNSINKDEYYEYNNNKISYDITSIPEEEEEEKKEENIIINKNSNILTIDDFNEWP